MRRKRTDSYAIASLACSLSACFGTFLAGSITGIILGKKSRARVAADPELDGEGLARAGIVLGWVGTAFGLFLLLSVLAGMFSSVSSSGSFDRELVVRLPVVAGPAGDDRQAIE
jgi:hypothetical protein